MRSISFVILFLSISIFSFAQGGFYVTGKVLSAGTNQPLVAASVFAQNTTIGTATDTDGNFKLYLPNGGYDLVITFTGHQTESKRVSSGETGNDGLVFFMKQKEKEMADVVITASNEVADGWVKYGSFFTDHFIGRTVQSKSCVIKNPEVLKFFYSKKRNRLKVMAAEPLQIENLALGYNIKYALDSFTHEYATEVSTYTGFPLFEEMTAADFDQKFKWAEARREAYKGSILHFMRSVFNKNLVEQGFEIQFVVKYDGKDTAIRLKDSYGALRYVRDDSTLTVDIRPNQQNLAVIYTREKPAPGFKQAYPDEPSEFQFSVLSFPPGESIVIEQNGYYYDQNDLAISAYWTWDKVANLLPYDYIPL